MRGGDEEAVGAAFWAFPQETLGIVSDVVLGNDVDAAAGMLDAVREADDLLPLDLWDRRLLDSIPARAVEARLAPERLLLLFSRLRAARTDPTQVLRAE